MHLFRNAYALAMRLRHGAPPYDTGQHVLPRPSLRNPAMRHPYAPRAIARDNNGRPYRTTYAPDLARARRVQALALLAFVAAIVFIAGAAGVYTAIYMLDTVRHLFQH